MYALQKKFVGLTLFGVLKMPEEEVNINLDKIKKIDPIKFIAVCMFIIAIFGMWYCFNWGNNNGMVKICENSGGIPIIQYGQAKCFIKYNPLNWQGNNLGLTENQVKKLEDEYYAKKK